MLTLEASAPIFAPLAGASGIVLAVSGGPDSVALMLLAAHWRQNHAGCPAMTVATVDHGLRAGSRLEAEAVAGFAAALGLPHRLLVWQGDKPESRLQEQARKARYGLLADCAALLGADTLVTAHHADDQAETILFRLCRGSGTAGLAGMRRSVPRDGLTHWRPLLDHPKSALIALCERAHHPWFEDASNSNPAFARTRLRHLGTILETEGFGREAILRLGARAHRADEALAVLALQASQHWPAKRGDDYFAGEGAALVQAPAEIMLRMLEAEILRLSPIDQLRLERLERLCLGLRASILAKSGFSGSLAGVVIKLDTAGTLQMGREKPRLRGRKPPPPDPG